MAAAGSKGKSGDPRLGSMIGEYTADTPGPAETGNPPQTCLPPFFLFARSVA